MAIVAFAFAACAGSNHPEAVAKKYLKAYQASDWKAMVAVMDMNDQDKEEFVQLCEAKAPMMLEETGGIKSFAVKNVEIAEDGKSAKVFYDMEYGNGKIEQDERINMVLVDGRWKVKFGF